MAKTVVMKLGFFGLTAPEINLFNTILKSSTRLAGEWRIADKGACDVIIYSHSLEVEESGRLVSEGVSIPVHRRNDKPDTLHILKPYRADEVVDALNSALSSLTTKDKQICNKTTKESKRYKLKSWPKKHILDVDKNYLHLATYLSRRPLTHNELITISNQPDDLCKHFIGLLLKEGLIDIVSLKLKPSRLKRQQNTSFFGFLKNRLGIGK